MTPRIRWSRWALIALFLFTASSAVIAATTSSNFRLMGNTATAIFEAFDPQHPCVVDFVAVAASDLVEKTSPGGKKAGSSPGTVLEVIQLDVCTDTVLFDALGRPAAHNFQVAGDLSSATLSAQVPVVDSVTRQVSTFEVNLTFQATAASEFLHSKETFQDPELGIKITAQSVSFHCDGNGLRCRPELHARAVRRSHDPEAKRRHAHHPENVVGLSRKLTKLDETWVFIAT